MWQDGEAALARGEAGEAAALFDKAIDARGRGLCADEKKGRDRVIRMTAKAMLLHANIPKKYWCYAISHATYLNNMTATSRADRTKTIYEVLFNSKPDVTRVPPYGAFTCIYKERRDLKDQSFDLTSIQGAFIGIAVHKKTLGYCISCLLYTSPSPRD